MPPSRSEASIDALIDLLDLEVIDVDLYRGRSPDTAHQRVPVRSLRKHWSLLGERWFRTARCPRCTRTSCAPGIPSTPIVYRVDSSRDGRSFTTAVSLQRPARRADLRHVRVFPGRRGWARPPEPMPSVPDPESLPAVRERIQAAAGAGKSGGRNSSPSTCGMSMMTTTRLAARCGFARWHRCRTIRCCRSACSPIPAISRCCLRHSVHATFPLRAAATRVAGSRPVVPPAVPCRRVVAVRPGHAVRVRREGFAAGRIFSIGGRLVAWRCEGVRRPRGEHPPPARVKRGAATGAPCLRRALKQCLLLELGESRGDGLARLLLEGLYNTAAPGFRGGCRPATEGRAVERQSVTARWLASSPSCRCRCEESRCSLPESLFSTWASAESTPCVCSMPPGQSTQFMIAHTADGFADLLRRLGKVSTDPMDLPVAIERPDGRLVDALLEAGHPVVPVISNAIKAWRDGEVLSGAKSDAGDAAIIAEYLRLRAHRLRPATPFSPKPRRCAPWSAPAKTSCRCASPRPTNSPPCSTRTGPAPTRSSPTSNRRSRWNSSRATPPPRTTPARRETAARVLRPNTATPDAAPPPSCCTGYAPPRRQHQRGPGGSHPRRRAGPGHRAQGARRRPQDLDRSVAAHLGEHPDAAIFTSLPRSGRINAAQMLAEWGDSASLRRPRRRRRPRRHDPRHQPIRETQSRASAGPATNTSATPSPPSPTTADTPAPGPPTSTSKPSPAAPTTPHAIASSPAPGSASSTAAGSTASPTNPNDTATRHNSTSHSPPEVDTEGVIAAPRSDTRSGRNSCQSLTRP